MADVKSVTHLGFRLGLTGMGLISFYALTAGVANTRIKNFTVIGSLDRMKFDEFNKLDKREVNKTIARKLGFICNDNWEFNQNAMRGGVDSDSWANLTLLRSKDDTHYSHIGWNPFSSGDSALGLIIDFNLKPNLKGLTRKEAKINIVYLAYLESIK